MNSHFRNLMFAAMTTAVAATAHAEAPTLYGTIIQSDDWNLEQGVYSFSAASPVSFTPLGTGYGFNADAGALYYNGTYVVLESSGNEVTAYYFDTTDWSQIDEDYLPATFMALDFAVDPTSGTVYGICSDGSGGIELATVDFDKRTRTAVAPLNRTVIALGINSRGDMYGITSAGILVKIDKSTGKLTDIGQTGITPAYMQSATFDLATDTFYWAAQFEDDMEGPMAGLYTVDLTTGAATRVARFSNCDQIVGLYCLNEAAAWEGPDQPVAPGNINVNCTRKGSSITSSISWEAPVAGIHGGEIDTDNLTYTITRLPEQKTVASGISKLSYTDIFDIAPGSSYVAYEVKAFNGELEGDAATSDPVTIDGGIILPYIQDFTDARTFPSLVIVDADNDGESWIPDASKGYASVSGTPFENASDWILTPEIPMTPDRLYLAKADLSAEYAANWRYTAALSFGTGKEPAGYTAVTEPMHIDDPAMQTIGDYFKVDNPALYRIGLNVYGIDIVNVLAHKITVEEGPMLASPEAVGNLTAVAGNNGALTATITFNAPATTIEGSAISTLKQIIIRYNGEDIETIPNPTPDKEYTFTHNTPAQNSLNSYTVVAVNESGEGMPATATTFVGFDTPKAPYDVKLTDAGDKAILTWKTDSRGINGGYVDTSALSYEITDLTYGDVIATVKDTRHEIQLGETRQQQWFHFSVKPLSDYGNGEAARSNALISGRPYNLPFAEGFAGSTNFWGSVKIPEESNWSSWAIENTEDPDPTEDGGIARFNGGYPKGSHAHFFSGKIDISQAKKPILDFWYIFRGEENDYTFDTYIVKNGTDTVKVDSRNYSHYHELKDFEKVRVSLADFKDSRYIQVLFDGFAGDDVALIMIDGVEVRDIADNDLRAKLNVDRTEANAGSTVTATVIVNNRGSKSAGSYTVNILDGDKIIKTAEGSSLESDATDIFTFEIPVTTLSDKIEISAEVVYDADEYTDDNVTGTVEVSVISPDFPAPATLNLNPKAGECLLEWSQPDFAGYTPEVTEGAENFEHASADLGEWTTIDADGLDTPAEIYIMWDPYIFPGAGAPMSFIAIDPAQTTLTSETWFGDPTGWIASEGTKFLASFSPADSNADDWLISPELSSDGLLFSFTYSGSNSGKIEVLVSSTGIAPEDFTSVKEFYTAGTPQKYSFTPEAGTRYVAIRNISGSNSFIVIDNISYRPLSAKGSLQLEGYNLYCDGTQFGTAAADETAATHSDATEGSHLYQVTARYTQGESTAASARTDISGVEAVSAGSAVETGRYSIDGLKVDDSYRGIVIIRYSDGSSRKALVK